MHIGSHILLFELSVGRVLGHSGGSGKFGVLSDPSVIRSSKYYLDSFKDGIPPANNCKTQYRNDNFFYVPIALVMVLLDIFPCPLRFCKNKVSRKMPPHAKCHFTRNFLVILYFNSGGIISRFVFLFMFTRGFPEHFLESGTDNFNKTVRNKVSVKMPPLTTCQFVRKYKGIRHFRSGGIVFW